MLWFIHTSSLILATLTFHTWSTSNPFVPKLFFRVKIHVEIFGPFPVRLFVFFCLIFFHVRYNAEQGNLFYWLILVNSETDKHQLFNSCENILKVLMNNWMNEWMKGWIKGWKNEWVNNLVGPDEVVIPGTRVHSHHTASPFRS